MAHLIGKGGGRGNPTPATGQVSAALTIWDWILTHGRPPKAHECRKKNGLHGYDLYYKVFGTNNFSSIIPLVSAICQSSVKIRQCLGWTHRGDDCPNTFPDVGAHVRLCESCRRHGASQPTEHHVPSKIEQYTQRQMGQGVGGWNRYQPWAQDIDWDGSTER